MSRSEAKTLSVVMCNYNHAKYLPQAIDAIISQSRPPDELIILDDGSTDNSLDIIETYAARVSYIKVFRHEKNKGFFAASKAVIDAATGDYFYGAAADDYVLPGFFQKAMAMAEQYPGVGVIFGGCQTLHDSGTLETFSVKRWRKPVFLPPNRYLSEYVDVEPPCSSFSGSSMIKRTAFFEAGGYRPELLSWCDTFLIRVVSLMYGACYIPEICATHRLSAGSISGSSRHNLGRMLEIITTAANLMRSPEYRHLFPESSVRSWEQRYRKQEILSSMYADYGRLLAVWRNELEKGSWFDRSMLFCCHCGLKMVLLLSQWLVTKKYQFDRPGLSTAASTES